ncbi:MFS transporter [Kitasatospora arboriphila]
MTVAARSRADEARAAPDRRPLVALLTANLVSITGNALAGIGVPWFVLQTTGSASRAGLVAFCQMLPLALSALAGGPVIDRIGRLRASVLSDVVCGAAVGLIPILQWAAACGSGSCACSWRSTGCSRRRARPRARCSHPISPAVPAVPLARAMSLYTSASGGARLLGASAAERADRPVRGLPGPAVGHGDLRRLGAPGRPRRPARLRRRPPPGRAAGEPAQVPRRTARGPGLPGPSAAAARHHPGADGHQRTGPGMAVGAAARARRARPRRVGRPRPARRLFAAGALGGSLLHAVVGDRLPRRSLYAFCLLVSGAPRMLVAAFAPGLLPLGVTLAVAGVAAGILNPIVSTVLYELVPDPLRSRVTGVLAAGVLLATPVGGLACGYLVDRAGLTTALVLLGGAYLLITLCPPAFPAWRRMDSTGDAGARP